MVKYTSIDTVLYELSTDLDERVYDETLFKEWITKGLRKFKLPAKYDIQNCIIPVIEHKAKVPSSAIQLVQLAYLESISELDANELKTIMGLDQEHLIEYFQNADEYVLRTLYSSISSNTGWKPMKLTTNNFHVSVINDTTIYLNDDFLPNLYECSYCTHEYSVDSDGCIITTLKNGFIYLAYKTYTQDANGNTLIPDNEDLKDALRHYALYRYWSRKPLTNETKYEREFHLSQFEVLKAKATADINYPDEAKMENIKNYLQRLVPRSNMRDKFFSQLSNKELTTYE